MKNRVLHIVHSSDPEGKFLRNIQTEINGIQDALSEITGNRVYRISIRALQTYKDLWKGLAQKGETVVFHYAGHADQEHLIFHNHENRKLRINGFAKYLQQQTQLQLVFLNACLSNNHRETLVNAEIPYLILVKTSVDDKVATNFAIEFYRSLGLNRDVETSFEEAKAKMLSIPRGFVKDAAGEYKEDEFPWELHIGKKAKKWSILSDSRSIFAERKTQLISLSFVCILGFLGLSLLQESFSRWSSQKNVKHEILADTFSADLNSRDITKKESNIYSPPRKIVPKILKTQLSIIDIESKLGIAGIHIEVDVGNRHVSSISGERGACILELYAQEEGEELRISLLDPQRRYVYKSVSRYYHGAVMPQIELQAIKK